MMSKTEDRVSQTVDEETQIPQTARYIPNGHCDPHDKEKSQKKIGSSVEENSHLQIIKFLVSIIVFTIILATGVLSKVSLLFMVSHIGENRKVPYCNKNLPKNDEFEAAIPTVQRIGWIWAIIFSFAIPELGSMIRAWRFCFFKNVPRAYRKEFIIVASAETLHVLGMALLIFRILPNMDVIQGVMVTNCLFFIPALLNIFTDMKRNQPEIEKITLLLNIFAMCGQVSGLIVWPLISDNITVWHIPVAFICISFHWWENFVSDTSRFTVIVKLNDIKKSIALTRYGTYLYVTVWKIIVFVFCAIWMSNINTIDFFKGISAGLGNHTIPVYETQNVTNGIHESVFSNPSAIYWTVFIQIMASYLCYIFTKFACKIKIQLFSFSLAINLTVPASICVLFWMCVARETNVCVFHDVIPDFLFFVPPPIYNLGDYILKEFGWLSILWILSQIWISRHIWNSKSIKNAPTDTLFVMPLYNGLIIDQSLVFNRRRHSVHELVGIKSKQASIRIEDKIPRLYVCATMWHEEKHEMLTFLNSLLRLDEDYCARRLARNYFRVDYKDCDYYDLETHIFFDNAFEKSQDINKYVKRFINCVSESAQKVYKREIKISPPIKYNTPYGGRLEWILPGNSKMIVHLKNSEKIRKKKRWSQVMFMYYLLSHKINEQPDMNETRKSVQVANTFILALDGDIDFQPNAAHLLMNRMKVDAKIGAACGRLHPVGDGPIVWFQKFEYAMAHWLNKSTEHVIGCVLCSPGCFSMFRGSALLTSVMRKFTKKSEEALHYLQFDQGEDRWLCTLILKQSFRVEYSAAADAYTNSPSKFNDLYIQRRRWIPSMIVNLFDLLNNSSEIIEKNENISKPYLIFQMMLFGATILGPATIFLMLIGALTSVFSIDIWTAFWWNLIPIILFIIICYKSRDDKFKLGTAFVLTAIYSLVMMGVLTIMILNIFEDGLMTPSAIFLVAVAGQIIIAGLLHPQELDCLFYGIIYYLLVPSIYMLLLIYSIFNMNNVNWGTREGTGDKKKNQLEDNNSALAYLDRLSCACCSVPTSKAEDEQLHEIIGELHEIKQKIQHLDTTTHNQTVPMLLNSEHVSLDKFLMNTQSPANPTLCDWQNEPTIINGKSIELDHEETKFWNELIEKYLQPINEDQAYNENKAKQLDELRDKYAVPFIMFNTLFVVVVFLLQLNKDVIHIKWPYGAKNEIFIDADSLEVILKRQYLQVEPIGVISVAYLTVILLIQFIAMLVHRFSTLAHILAETNLNWTCRTKSLRTKLLDPNRKTTYSINGPNAVKFAKKLQKPEEMDDNDSFEVVNILVGPDQSNLEENFKRNSHLTYETRAYQNGGFVMDTSNI